MRRIDEIDEEVLLALKDSPEKLREIGLLVKSERIAKRRTEKLLRYGLIKRIRQGVYALSSKGKAYVKKLTPTIAITLNDPKLEALIDKLPAEPHKAIFRLTLSGITAKLLLFKYFDNNWPASTILGPTKTFKTGLIEVICKIIKGLDFVKNNYYLYRGTPGDIGLRRFKTKGKAKWDVSASYLFNERLASFDEWDKASPELKKIALSFADGRKEFTVENKKIVNHAYAVIIANTTPKGLGIPDYIIRRSIVVNTDFIKDELKDIDLKAGDIFAFLKSSKAPEIDLAKLSIPETKLSDQEFLFMRDLFMENVAEDYKNLVDTQPLQILSLGRLCLLGSKDVKEAIFQTVWDRLECLETMEGAKIDWRKRIRDPWLEYKSTEQPRILVKIKEAEEKEKRRKERIEKTKEEVIREKAEKIEKEDLLFINERATLIAKLRELRDELPREKKWQNKCFPLKEEIKSLIERIRGVRNSQDLEVYYRVLPGIENKQKKLMEEIKETENKEKRLEEEEEVKQEIFEREKDIVKERYETLKKALKTYAKLTGGMAEQYNQDNERYLESLFYRINKAKDIESLDSIKLKVEKIEKDTKDKISSLEERRRETKEKEEEMKEGRKKEQEAMKELKALQDKKNILLERKEKDTFDGKYLTSQEKAELDIFQNYQKKKKAPIENISLFLKERKLVNQVNIFFTHLPDGRSIFDAFFNSYLQQFGQSIPTEVYRAVDGQVYPLNYFTSWDRAKGLIQIKIDQLRNKAITERRTQLLRQVAPLEEKEKSLKPPLYYLRTDRRLVRVKYYLGEKEARRLHFKFEDGRVWMLPKGRGWTVQTKIDYGGELLPFISEKGSTIGVQTDEGEREISKDRIFSYIYEYKGPEPT